MLFEVCKSNDYANNFQTIVLSGQVVADYKHKSPKFQTSDSGEFFVMVIQTAIPSGLRRHLPRGKFSSLHFCCRQTS